MLGSYIKKSPKIKTESKRVKLKMAGPRKKPEDHLTGAQLRGALGILNMSVLQLAERTGLSPNTVKRALVPNGPAPINVANARLIATTLEAAGVTLLAAEGSAGAGARLSTPDVVPLTRRRRLKGIKDGDPSP